MERPERSRPQSSQLVNETQRPTYYDSLLAHYRRMRKNDGDERLATMLSAASDVTPQPVQMAPDQKKTSSSTTSENFHDP